MLPAVQRYVLNHGISWRLRYVRTAQIQSSRQVGICIFTDVLLIAGPIQDRGDQCAQQCTGKNLSLLSIYYLLLHKYNSRAYNILKQV